MEAARDLECGKCGSDDSGRYQRSIAVTSWPGPTSHIHITFRQHTTYTHSQSLMGTCLP